jgi:hypothetical protein
MAAADEGKGEAEVSDSGEPKHIAQVLAEMALDHAKRAYAFAPSTYTHAAMMSLHGVVRGKLS